MKPLKRLLTTITVLTIFVLSGCLPSAESTVRSYDDEPRINSQNPSTTYGGNYTSGISTAEWSQRRDNKNFAIGMNYQGRIEAVSDKKFVITFYRPKNHWTMEPVAFMEVAVKYQTTIESNGSKFYKYQPIGGAGLGHNVKHILAAKDLMIGATGRHSKTYVWFVFKNGSGECVLFAQ